MSENKIKLPFLVLWVGTKCNLRCKDCVNLIPYTEQKSYDFESSINDFKMLTQIADIESLQIQGGEPFTHPKIDEFLYKIGSRGGEFSLPMALRV